MQISQSTEVMFADVLHSSNASANTDFPAPLLTLTQTLVVTRQLVSVTTGAVVTAHGVITVMLTGAVPSAALIYIYKPQTHKCTVNQSGRARVIGWSCAGGRSSGRPGRKSLTLSSEHEEDMNESSET